MSRVAALLERLLRELPSADAPTQDIAEQARGAFAILVRATISTVPGEKFIAKESECPNCGGPAKSMSSPYCGSACREESGFVRQVRRAISLETVFDHERQSMFGQLLWSLLGGGYPARHAIVPERTKQSLFKRDHGQCRVCGQPATTFDHVKTGCNRPINLQSVCGQCIRMRPFGDPDFLARPEVQEELERLAMRIGADEPLRLSDDPLEWDWRAFIAERKRLVQPK